MFRKKNAGAAKRKCSCFNYICQVMEGGRRGPCSEIISTLGLEILHVKIENFYHKTKIKNIQTQYWLKPRTFQLGMKLPYV